MLSDLPGGLQGLTALVAAFHQRGVRVLLCYNPWDTGTNNAYSRNNTPFSRVAQAVHAVGADGVNGDQMYGVPAGFLEASRQASVPAGQSMVLEPEICFNNSVTGVGTDAMTWSGAFAFDSLVAPLTLAYKIVEPRHMVHVLHR